MYYLKRAFTLIELIFAIVIIGISVVSLPMITQVTNTSIENSIAQEAILLSSADLIRAISGKWDENSRVGNQDFEYIVYTSDAEVAAAAGTPQRPGNIQISYHPDNTLRVTNAVDLDANGKPDDVDDYVTAAVISVDEAASASNFKDQYKKIITVANNQSFGDLAANANIKKITITTQGTIESGNYEDLVQMYMYVMNTGSSSANARTLP